MNVFDLIRTDWAVQRNIPYYKRPYHILINFVARLYLNLFFRGTIIGVTGSVGKTTTKEFLFQILSDFRPVATEDNLDPIFNIPKTILKLRPKNKVLILEMGVEYPGEMDYYLTLAKPDIAIITKISITHTEFFKNKSGVLAEKLKILQFLSRKDFAIIESQDKDLAKVIDKIGCRKIRVGPGGEVSFDNFKLGFDGSHFRISYKNKSYRTAISLLGRHNAYLASLAFAVGVSLGVKGKTIIERLGKAIPAADRLNLTKTRKGFYLLSDVYNASPEAVKAAFEVLKELQTKGAKIVVLSDMKELGGLEKVEHEKIGKLWREFHFDELLLWGDAVAAIAGLLKSDPRVRMFADKSQLASYLGKNLKKEDAVLVKGSHSMKMEEVVGKLKAL